MMIDLLKEPEKDFVLIPEKPAVYWVMVTPEMAAYWLERYNTHNRNWRGITAYVNDMKNGRWILNGDTITFGRDGAIQNGQHRLASIVESGVALKLLIVCGLEPEAQATVDGGYMRLLKEQLLLRGHSNSSYLAAIGTRVMNAERYGILDPRTLRTASIVERIEFIEEHNERLRAASAVTMQASGSGIRKFVAPTVIGSAWAICSVLESGGEEKADQFYVQNLIRMVGLSEDHPAGALRRRFESEVTQHGKKIAADDAIQYTALAWGYWVDGRTVSKIQAPKGGFRSGQVSFK